MEALRKGLAAEFRVAPSIVRPNEIGCAVKRIGEIAARLVANPVELVAAANQKRSTELDGAPEAKRSDVPFMGSMGGGAPLREEGESEAPIAQASLEEPMASNARMGKGLSPKAQPSVLGDHHVKDPSPAPKGRPVLLVIAGGRGRAIAHPAKGRPQPRVVARPMLSVIVGGRHATSP